MSARLPPFAGFDLSGFWEDSDDARKEYIEAAPDADMVARVEARLGYRLPASDITLMRRRNGGIPVPCCFPAGGIGWAEDHVKLSAFKAIGEKRLWSLIGSNAGTPAARVMNRARHTMIALVAFAMAGIPWRVAEAEQRPSIHVAACGLEFDLPAGYRITRPTRQQDPRDGRQCAFDIVPAKYVPPLRGECKDEEDGGQPPFDVCDWMIDAGPETPAVQVARTRLGGSPLLDSFLPDSYLLAKDSRWMVPNAQAGDQPAKAATYCGKPAWKGETIVRGTWYRTRTRDFAGIYAGSFGADVTLVQLAPDLYVQLQNPPIDDAGEFSVFCASLRLGARTQDLP